VVAPVVIVFLTHVFTRKGLTDLAVNLPVRQVVPSLSVCRPAEASGKKQLQCTTVSMRRDQENIGSGGAGRDCVSNTCVYQKRHGLGRYLPSEVSPIWL
jgi:hypothetical protein